VTIAFEARIVGGAAIATPEALEVRTFAPADIPWDGIAFNTTHLGAARLARAPPSGAQRAETTHATF
jgi:hypothetical protein